MAATADLADPALWHDELAVHTALARLRSEAAVSWQREAASLGVTPGPGYWAVVRHRDVVAVSTDPGRFSSAAGTSIRTLPAEVDELLGSMLNMDDPRHARLRRVVSHAFTARHVGALDEHIRRAAVDLVDKVRAEGGGDLVAALAAPLPLRIVCDLVGIPHDHREAVAANSETLGTSRDAHAMLAAAAELHGLAVTLAEARRLHPGDDLLTALVHADVDGESLTPAEVGSFFTLLVVAGTQTVRHVIAGGVVALDEHPEQHERRAAALPAATPLAVEEIVRWVTPVRHFRRTATCDTELAGTRITAGDKVVVWYTAANRDPSVFDDPDRLDLARRRNPHLGYGVGPHHCLGARLARCQLAAAFTALLSGPRPLRVTGADRIASAFANGYRTVHVEL